MKTHQSKIEKLIAELCPHGVEFRRLGNVSEIKRGTSITKKNIINGDIPVIAGGKKPAYYHNESNRSGETIVIAGSGAYAGFISWWEKPIFASDAFTVKPNNELLAKYCFYFLKNLQQQIHDLKSGGGVPHVYPRNVAPLQIAIPPLTIQKEIVRILDAFAELTTKLTTKLTTELTARKKQYSYYRDQLLAFEGDEVDYKKLEDICKINTGQKPDEILDKTANFDYINAGTTRSGYCMNSNCEGDTVTTPSRGQGGIGYVGYQKESFWLGPLCYKMRSKDKIQLINKYLFYFLQSNNDLLFGLKKEGGVPAVNKSDLAKILIPVPSLEEQARIVSILDKFDTLTHSISEGLPREIALRQKQYEYYRDLLLHFPQFPSSGGVAGEA